MDQFKKLLMVAGLFAVVLVGLVMAKRHLNEIAREVAETPVDLSEEPEQPGTANEGLILETMPPAETADARP